MSHPPSCKYDSQPGGCRRKNCTFSHSAPGSSRPRASINTARPPPGGVCRFYWSNRSCREGTSCRFAHLDNPSLVANTQGPSTSTVLDSIVPFLTDEGLAKVSGVGTDSLAPQPATLLAPSQIRYRLQRFLEDEYRFKTTFDVYAFFIPLSSSLSTNPSWSIQDGQTLLYDMSKPNALLRFGDIIRWPSVSPSAGSDRQVLSFQRAWFPLLQFFSSDTVVKSTLHSNINALYAVIMNDIEPFSNTLISCMDQMINKQSFRDPANSQTQSLLGSQVLACVASVLFECLTRFKNAVNTHPNLTTTVRKLQSWLDSWVTGVRADPPKFDDVFTNKVAARGHIIELLSSKVRKVTAIVNREQERIERQQKKDAQTVASQAPSSTSQEGLAAMLQITFQGPGPLCSTGPRHDNDALDIQNIRIAPTNEELICTKDPFLPANFHAAPHHLPSDSMERLLDIQFRLLREELTAPLRLSIQCVRNDLLNRSPKTKLAPLLAKRGGKYRGAADAEDSVMFNIYTGVKFHSMTPDHRGLSVNISFDTPPGRARQASGGARAAFWEAMSGKRMMQGGLIALVWARGTQEHRIDVHLGIIASHGKDLAMSARQSPDRVSTRIVFFDPEVEIRILDILKFPHKVQGDQILLVESPVMYEAIRPFLEALTVEPETIPFQQTLVQQPRGFFSTYEVKPPLYSTLPRFSYRLGCLFEPGTWEGHSELTMVVSDRDSVENARNELKRASRLDESQVDAVVDTLTREVALIQGPPGTGKSFTGVELLRVLVQHARPILMIAFTNHALDHLLTSVLDACITDKLVRLGSRSADERISQYSIENLEFASSERSRLGKQSRWNLKNIQQEISALMEKITRKSVSEVDISGFIQDQYPEHYEYVSNPPSWIKTVMELAGDSNGSEETWKTVKKGGAISEQDDSPYARWLRAEDLDFLRHRPDLPSEIPPDEKLDKSNLVNRFTALSFDTAEETSSSNSTDSQNGDGETEDDSSQASSEDEDDWERLEITTEVQALAISPTLCSGALPPQQGSDSGEALSFSETLQENDGGKLTLSDFKDPVAFFTAHSMDIVPEIPRTNRSLDDLLAEGQMWNLSLNERRKLDQYWRDRTRERMYQEHLLEFQDLREKHTQALKVFNEERNELRRNLLRGVDIIGCTTTGAAKFVALLKGMEPKIMLVEEAGQVMEAHILATLVPSIQHLIMIGDPLQLRPTLNNYKLSIDSTRGKKLYKFDMSLMGRLSSSGFPMSRIDIQRRMRPQISQLIRKALYPSLADHNLVKQYPDVRGLARNVYFLTHEHRENDGNEDDASSKFNTYEVEMIRDMVLYLLRQGCYSQDGDIVVLCAYLGQLARVRDALARHVAIVIDERDQVALADQEAENETEESKIEHVQVSKRVRLRTVDNYQGEEAKIVILSLVRNAGEGNDSARIGFLRSANRANVALSRAKHGLFVLGNAYQLAAKSTMWATVIEELQLQGNIGRAFPFACSQHPDKVNNISEPGRLSLIAPDGGCLEPCGYRLKCGHVCPYKCHPDDKNHVAVTCGQSCRRLCPRNHPCSLQCSQECGQCMYPISHVELPCGHFIDSVPCYMIEDLGSVRCGIIVAKQLTSCEHTADMPCSADIDDYQCRRPCDGIMGCCGRNCGALCHDCQAENQAVAVEHERIVRQKHRQHLCKKLLHCGHGCVLPCSQDHKCTTMCRQACRQECTHSCCPQYCSTPCEPCKEACAWNCSHHVCPLPCGSVCTRMPCDRRCEKILSCGHRCPSVCGEDCSIQICPTCAPAELQEVVVDLILYLKLGDVLPDQGTLDNMLIRLPKCGHVFTVETLDGICGLEEYYSKDSKGDWFSLSSPQRRETEEMKNLPMCPTCRTAITSPRYGRVFKSANLDVLERNVISHMSTRLNGVQTSLDAIVKTDLTNGVINAANHVKPNSVITADKEKKRARKTALDDKMQQRPVSVENIKPSSKLFSIAPQVSKVWNTLTRHLLKAYKDAATICDIRSAHINAWQAAFSFLHEQEMNNAVAEPTLAPRRLPEHAMRVARLNVGIPQPRADKRFFVEAMWFTIQIRFTLVELAQTWIKTVGESQGYEIPERQEWGKFGIFLLRACERDIKIAYEVAEASESRRQMTKSQLLHLRAQLETCRFRIEMTRQCGIWDVDQRKKFAELAKAEGEAAARMIVVTTRDHLTALRDDKHWMRENFLAAAKTIKEEWETLERALKADTFYEPLSLDEKMAIVKAFDFTHTGHFYTCQNGHVFVIGECGGAMQASICPECGQRIGGSNHALESSNARADEFERLARDVGARASPWAWGR